VADNVIYAFYIGAGVLILSILYTIFTTKEYSPKNLRNLKEKKGTDQTSKFTDIFKDFANIPSQMKRLGAVQFFHGLHCLPCGYLQPVL
jgi:maltose/moltooligosaccharide transporter